MRSSVSAVDLTDLVAASDDMPTFHALSYREKRRVTRSVAKGKAPQDPRMAAAAVELAENYQRRRGESPLHRFLAIALILIGAALAIWAVINGDALLTGAMALMALTNVAQLAINPMCRPKNVARSLEASKRISVAD
jgi:hypothetical protein